MKKAKLKTNKGKKVEEKKVEGELMSGKSMAIVLVVIVAVFGIFYWLTTLLLPKKIDNTNANSNTNTNATATNQISFSKLLKQSEDKYYVFAILEDDPTTVYTRYASSMETKYYEVNMKEAINKTYIGEKTNISDSVKDIRIADSTLFVIEKGKITEYYVGSEDIINYLSKNVPKQDSSNS